MAYENRGMEWLIDLLNLTAEERNIPDECQYDITSVNN